MKHLHLGFAIASAITVTLLHLEPIKVESHKDLKQFILGGQNVLRISTRPIVLGSFACRFVDRQKFVKEDDDSRDKNNGSSSGRSVIPRAGRGLGYGSRPETEESDGSQIRSKVYEKAVERFGSEEAEAVLFIVEHESGFNQYARNGRCCGLFQRLDKCGESDLQSAERQIEEGLNYIERGSINFHTPSEAKYFWEVTSVEKTGRHWY